MYNEILYNWDGKNVRRGSSAYANVLYNYNGKYVRKGSNPYGEILYNIEGKIPIALLIFLIEGDAGK